MHDGRRIKPIISIGMPVFNGEEFIRQALDSILCQTFDDFELVISDNASTDATAEICSEYVKRDNRIRYIKQVENIGALANFQYVLNESVGSFFIWAAADDFWDDDWLRMLHRRVVDLNVGAAFGQVVHIDDNSKLIPHFATGKIFDYTGFPWWRRLKFFCHFEGSGKANLFYSLHRRAVLSDLRVEKFEHDYHQIFYLLKISPVYGVSGVNIYKRIHDNATSVLMINKRRGLFRKILLRLFFPVDLTFLKGYFGQAPLGEKLILMAAMPIKYWVAYLHMVRRFGHAMKNLLSEKRVKARSLKDSSA